MKSFIQGPLSLYLIAFSYNADMHICLHPLYIAELTGSPYFICHVLCICFIVVLFLGGKSVWMSFSFFSGSKPYIMALFTYFWLLLPVIIAAPCYHCCSLLSFISVANQKHVCFKFPSIQNDLTVWLHLLVDASLTASSANLNWILIRICCSKKGMMFSCVLCLIILLE